MTPWTVAHQAPLSMGLRQEYWIELPCPPPGDLPSTEIEPKSHLSPALAGRFFTTTATGSPTCNCFQKCFCALEDQLQFSVPSSNIYCLSFLKPPCVYPLLPTPTGIGFICFTSDSGTYLHQEEGSYIREGGTVPTQPGAAPTVTSISSALCFSKQGSFLGPTDP